MQDKIEPARISWTTSGTPRSELYGDIYYSAAGGPEESRHVFLQGNRLAERWQQLHGNLFVIGELGFGSGLNFLLCWQLWDQCVREPARLHYLAFEKHPLDRQTLSRICKQWPALDKYSNALLGCYPDHTPGLHRLHLSSGVTLDLCYGDACTMLQAMQSSLLQPVDCWFLDGFSPRCNPELWSERLLFTIAGLSRNGTTVSSYSVAGQVRRTLVNCGFAVTKQPGYGGKRDMLTAVFDNPHRRDSQEQIAGQIPDPQPWFKLSVDKVDGKVAAIIGAGLAGCATASQLARRGWQVLLFDSQPSAAAGASGNPQAVLHCRLANNRLPGSRFHLLSYLYASRTFQQLQEQGHIRWQQCGFLQLENPADACETKAKDFTNFYEPAVIRPVSQSQAAELTNLALNCGGWWLPHGGWLQPAELCAAYIDHIGITRHFGVSIDSMERRSGRWELYSGQRDSFDADIVVIANGMQAGKYTQTATLPLLPVRGQITLARKTLHSSKLSCVIGGEKYFCPADGEQHAIGASYQPGEENSVLRPLEDCENLQGMATVFTDLNVTDMRIEGSRAAVRCTAPDHLPVIGPVPDYQAMNSVFGELSRNARTRIQASPVYHSGLFINTAHGSYGLSTCPLAGEYLAALINEEPLPLNREMTDALHPARFMIRALRRQRISGN